MKSSPDFDLDKTVPSDYTINDFEKCLRRDGLMITTDAHPNNSKTLAMKWTVLILLFTISFKFLILTQIDTNLEENRIWVFIIGDISFIFRGIRQFFLIFISSFIFCSCYLIYSFSFTRNLSWLELFLFLGGKNGLTPRQMGILDVEIVKEIIARYKAFRIFAVILFLISRSGT
jgi:hypothetical protein